MTISRQAAAVGAGFIVGSLIGFLWAQSTRRSLADNIKTRTEGGKLLIEVDALGAAAQGLYDMLDG